MQRREKPIYSPAVGRELNLLIFGHAGLPVIVFPTYGTLAGECEENGMVSALANLIDTGRIRLYCIDSIDKETWLQKRLDPHWRAVRHGSYESFIMSNLVPTIRKDCQEDKIRFGTMGSDLGAYHALNFTLKYPEVFEYALCMSGLYDLDEICGKKSDTLDFYYNNPMAYVPNLEDEDLEWVRDQVHVTLVCGQGHWDERSLDETRRMGELLQRKGVSHELDLWGHDVTPDWHWWQKEAVYHLNKYIGPPEAVK